MMSAPNPADDGIAPYMVLGVGADGCDAIRHMIPVGLPGATLACVDTDTHRIARLRPLLARRAVLLGGNVQREQRWAHSRDLAERSSERIRALLADVPQLVIVAGLGEPGGAKITPVVARIAQEQGIRTAGVFTLPMNWEPPRRHRRACDALMELHPRVKVRCVLPLEDLLDEAGDETDMNVVFHMAHEIMMYATVAIAAYCREDGHTGSLA
jgi:cell division GTPase FtsZ